MDVTPTAFSDISLTGYKGVLLDLDNTVYAHDSCHDTAIKSVWMYLDCHLGSTYTKDDYATFYQKGRKAIQKRLLPQGVCRSRLLYFQTMLEFMSISSAHILALELESVYIDSFLNHMKIDKGALEFIERCNENSIPICVITNLNTQFQIKKLTQLDLDQKIDFLVTSEEAGVEKPASEIFDLALEKLQLNRHDVLMVGDNIKFDIIGARDLGVDSILVNIV